MFKKSVILSLFTLVIVFFLTPYSKAEKGDPGFSLLAPAKQQSVSFGDTVKIVFQARDLIPSDNSAITIDIIERGTNKRTRVGYITRKNADDIYNVNWNVPENFFKAKRIKTSVSHFRIQIKARHNNRWIRSTSQFNILKIFKNEPKSITSTVKTIVSVDEKKQEAVSLITDKSLFVARYEFKSLLEPWIVKKLTVVNDTEGDGFDPDPNETTNIIDKIYVRYPNADGETVEKQAPFTDGKAVLSNLDFYIPERSSAYLDIFVDPVDSKAFGEKYSGHTFRVGIQDSANTSATFEAVGQISGATDNTFNSLKTTSSDIHEFAVRKGVPDFKVLSPDKQSLVNGENYLYEFSISGNSLSLGRIVFDITQTGLTSLDQVNVFRNGAFLPPGDAITTGKVYLMWDAGATSCFAHTPQSGAGTGMDCNGGIAPSAKLILSFTQEEILWDEHKYRLLFNVSGADPSDRVSIRISHLDDEVKPTIPGSETINGKIYNAGAGFELFTNATDFASEATSITDRNIIWSDRSADYHQYTTITPALSPITDTASSADWTNGYLLKLNILPTVTSIR